MLQKRLNAYVIALWNNYPKGVYRNTCCSWRSLLECLVTALPQLLSNELVAVNTWVFAKGWPQILCKRAVQIDVAWSGRFLSLFTVDKDLIMCMYVHKNETKMSIELSYQWTNTPGLKSIRQLNTQQLYMHMFFDFTQQVVSPTSLNSLKLHKILFKLLNAVDCQRLICSAFIPVSVKNKR